MSSESGARLLTVLNDDGTIAGIINQSDIAQMYIDSERDWKKLYAETPFSNLLDILKLKTVYGEYKYENIAGNLYIEEFDKNFSDKDVIITRADKRAKAAAEAAKNSEPGAAGAVVVVEKPLDEIVLLTRSAVSVSAIMKKGGIFKFAAENYIDDIVDFMKTSAHRNFPVVDKDDKFLGIISRRHLLDYRRKKVILVDHNENSQSVEGLNSAVILEIIDHHRIADVQTDSPVFVRAEPVGCTATIVYKMYKENDVPITRRIAGILLSAILSDTLMMRSPTATPEDRKAVDNLSIVAEVEINQYGREMFTAGTSLTGVTSAQILTNDLKIFTFGRYASSVSQFLTLDFESLQERNDELIKELENFRAEKKLDLAILMITDIVEGGSEIFVAASDPAKRFVADTFGVPSVDKSIFLEGVVSRKKQMVPKLTVAAQRN
jgi:manganese-dependent inorganic pyrophosphatase